ncbi:enterochelin esterase [Streptomyces sp. NBC_00102]|uniref:enterochelin esterase n=1 Tax=Streptomyces sp. NBC_00102 TaxID=2975652 RepID=UPI00225BA695|nr:enterochelin esterase [Streptomyces sp. NBC_00102]MCX5400829.1 enterochelin esterase [Streptomyces sp. NBC_00102]
MFASAPPEGAPHRPPRTVRPDAIPLLAAPGVELPGPEGLEGFWARVRETGTPLIAPDPQGSPDHAAVTFLWRGTEATRAVQVMPNKLGDPRLPEGNLMECVPGTDVWHWTLRLRRDWRGTYDFHVDEGDGPEADGPGYWQWLRTRRRADPHNSRRMPRRWGGEPVSWAEIRESRSASDWEPRTGVPRGTVTEHAVPSERLGEDRRIWLYEPPAPADGGRHSELPVLVLLDGEHWQPSLGLAGLLDNLVADGRIPPTAAIFVDSVDSGSRWRDLACRPDHAAFLADELLPWAARRLPLTDDPARTVIAGQSLGGLSATYTALTAPHRFGNALVQSASYWWPDGPEPEWLTGRIAAAPRRPVRLRLSFGEQEWVALPAARRLRDALEAAGYDCEYREFNGGHDYLWWRTEMADGLVRLLGSENPTRVP